MPKATPLPNARNLDLDHGGPNDGDTEADRGADTGQADDLLTDDLWLADFRGRLDRGGLDANAAEANGRGAQRRRGFDALADQGDRADEDGKLAEGSGAIDPGRIQAVGEPRRCVPAPPVTMLPGRTVTGPVERSAMPRADVLAIPWGLTDTLLTKVGEPTADVLAIPAGARVTAPRATACVPKREVGGVPSGTMSGVPVRRSAGFLPPVFRPVMLTVTTPVVSAGVPTPDTDAMPGAGPWCRGWACRK